MNDYTAGSTSVVETVFLQDSTATTGAGKTALLYSTSGLTCYYKRSNGTASVAVTLATITTFGTFTSGGFKEIDATGMPGCYEFHPPDAAFASGAKHVTFFFVGATGLSPRPIKVRILAVNPDSAAFGLTLAKTTNITGFNDIAATAVVSAGAITTSSGAVSTVTVTGSVTGSVGSVASSVTVGTNTDKTGYSLSQAFPTNFSSLGISVAGKINGVVLADTVTTLTNLPAITTDWLSAAGVSAAAVTKIQSGLSTYAGGDTSGTTALLSRVTSTRAGYLDNLSVTPLPANLTQVNGVAASGAGTVPATLVATGLDAIAVTDPGGVATTFPQMVVQTWRRFYRKTTKTTTQIKTYGDDGATVRTTQTVSDDNAGNQTQGAAS